MELLRHGDHPAHAVQLYGSQYMDQYQLNPGSGETLWGYFTAADTVCRGAYLQLLFDCHSEFLITKWRTTPHYFNHEDRARVMYLVTKRKSPRWESPVFQTLESDPDEVVREKAGMALSVFSASLNIKKLKQILSKETSSSVQSAILLALPITDNSPALVLLSEFMNTDETSLGLALISILATSELKAKRSYLEQMSTSTNTALAQSALAALDHLLQKDRLEFQITGIQSQPQPEPPAFNQEKQGQLLQALADARFTHAETLLASGASLHYGASTFNTLLHELAQTGDPASIRWALSKGCNLETPNFRGEPPLLDLAFSHQADWQQRTALLLELGANINATNTIGETALHIAARLGNATIATFFLKHGADPTLRDHSGRSPRETALLLENTAVAALFP